MGMGWVVTYCVFQQVPFFEAAQSEGVCINAHISLAVALGCVVAIINVIYTFYYKPLNYNFSVLPR
jgi:hypothetical protein